ncbi:hypothetical protein HFP71_16845 [Streptomyces sp. ARC32]
MSNTVLPFPSSLGEVLASADAAAVNRDVARARARITVGQALEAAGAAAFEPLGVIVSGDAAVTDPDVARRRACTTVAQAEAAAEKEGARLFFLRHFPEMAEFNGHDVERPVPSSPEPLAAGLMAAAVDKVLRKVLPDLHTPEVVAALAADITTRLARINRPTEAAQTGTCSGLGGACVADHASPLFTAEERRCHGLEVSMPDPYGGDFPSAELVQWTDDEAPHLNVGQDTPELDLAGVDQLLIDLHQYAARIAELRAQLARLQGGAAR